MYLRFLDVRYNAGTLFIVKYLQTSNVSLFEIPGFIDIYYWWLTQSKSANVSLHKLSLFEVHEQKSCLFNILGIRL